MQGTTFLAPRSEYTLSDARHSRKAHPGPSPRGVRAGLLASAIVATALLLWGTEVSASPPSTNLEITDVYSYWVNGTTCVICGTVSGVEPGDYVMVFFGGVLTGYSAVCNEDGSFSTIAEFPQWGIANAHATNNFVISNKPEFLVADL
jgi:hypothetical protein